MTTPTPPREAGHLPENLAEIIESEMMHWRGANGGIYTIHACALGISIAVRSALAAAPSPAQKEEDFGPMDEPALFDGKVYPVYELPDGTQTFVKPATPSPAALPATPVVSHEPASGDTQGAPAAGDEVEKACKRLEDIADRRLTVPAAVVREAAALLRRLKDERDQAASWRDDFSHDLALVERERDAFKAELSDAEDSTTHFKVACERAEARLEEAREVLRPFALSYDEQFHDEDERSLHMTGPAHDLTHGNLRRAREVLARLSRTEAPDDRATVAEARLAEVEKERDEARAYAAEVRLREKAAEDARVSAVDRLAEAERALREIADRYPPSYTDTEGLLDEVDWMQSHARAALAAMEAGDE